MTRILRKHKCDRYICEDGIAEVRLVEKDEREWKVDELGVFDEPVYSRTFNSRDEADIEYEHRMKAMYEFELASNSMEALHATRT